VTAASFPRSLRLLRGTEFEACFAHRQRLAGRFFLIHWLPSPAGSARLGLAVSRKVDPRAVQRNRLKRLLRDFFRRHREALPPLDLVVLPKREAASAEAAALRADLERLWQRLASLPRPDVQGTMPAASPPSAAGDAVTPAAAEPSLSVPQR
jgi:ribonuclease P protein component